MKVVVTGGAGYVGSVVTTELIMSGFDAIAFDKLVYGGESLMAFQATGRRVLVRGDLRVDDDLRGSIRDADAVVHLGAVVGEPACALNENQAWDINLEGTRRALAISQELGVTRFIYVSTCSNYGVSAPDVLATEQSPLNPLSLYAKAKVEAETLALTHAGSMATTVLRLGTICGLSPRMRFDLLVSDMARAAALGQPIGIFAPEAWRPFLHIRDASNAVKLCLTAQRSDVERKVFNVVGENHQKKGLVDIVLRHYPRARIEVTSRLPDLRDYRVSGEKIRHELAFEPSRTVEEAFVETADAVAGGWFRDPFWAGHSAIPANAGLLDVQRKAA